MKKRHVSLVACLLAVLLSVPFFSMSSHALEEPPQVVSSSALVYNLETDSYLLEKNTEGRLNPAAFTKLMTALLAYEYRDVHGNVSVTVTEAMLNSVGGTTMNLKVGEQIDLDSLLMGLVIQNANDAALVIASAVAGSVPSFVEKMNVKAGELGMKSTYYSNPTGVDSAVMYTTLKDTLILCKALYRVNDFIVLSEKPKVEIPATNKTGKRQYTNKNALVPFSYVTDYYMPNVRGMIAGYTGGAGYCVATLRQTETTTFLVLISGGKDYSAERNGTDISSYRDAKKLMEWAEKEWALRAVVKKGQVICERAVRLGADVDHMILVAKEEWIGLFPKDVDFASEIELRIVEDRPSYLAPIVGGEEYGKIELVYQGDVIGTVSLVAQTNVRLSHWLVFWDAVVGFFSQGTAKWVLILLIFAMVLYVLILILTVWLQYVRKNRARAMAIAELNEQENLRLKNVRMEEKKASRLRLIRVRNALHEGFRVLSGDSQESSSDENQSSDVPQKAVAKIPEKYKITKKKKEAPSNDSEKPSFEGRNRKKNSGKF